MAEQECESESRPAYLAVDRGVEDMIDVELDILSPSLLGDQPVLSIGAEGHCQNLPHPLLRGCEVLAEDLLYWLVTCIDYTTPINEQDSMGVPLPANLDIQLPFSCKDLFQVLGRAQRWHMTVAGDTLPLSFA